MPGANHPHPLVLAIAGAPSEEEIVRLVSQYVGAWTQADLTLLPQICRPPPMESGDELVLHAVILARYPFEGIPARHGRHTLEELRNVFREAAIRLTDLRTPADRRERRLLGEGRAPSGRE